MTQIECPFCGAVCPSGDKKCVVCDSFISQNPVDNGSPKFAPPEFISNYAPRNYQNPSNYAVHPQTNPQFKNCLDCNAPIASFRQRCDNCISTFKGTSSKFYTIFLSRKFLVIFIISLFVCGLIYVVFPISSQNVFNNYAAATKIDDSLIYENYVLKGKGVFIHRKMNESTDVRNFTFNFVREKPNKMSLEYNGFDKSDMTANTLQFYLKRSFTGNIGTEYMYFANQTWVYDLVPEDVVNSEYNLELPRFSSAEIKDINCAAPANFSNPVCIQRSYSIDGENQTVMPAGMTVIEAEYKFGHDKYRASTLYFDKKEGFLIMQVQKTRFNKTDVTSYTQYKNYRKFSAHRRNFLGGIQKIEIYFPSEIQINMSTNSDFDLTLKIEIESLQFDQAIDQTVYEVPQSNEK